MSTLDNPSQVQISPDGAVTFRKRNAPTAEEVAARIAALNERPLTAIAYIRSSDDASGMGGSLGSQRDTYLDDLMVKGITPLLFENGEPRIYEDNDISAYKLGVVR